MEPSPPPGGDRNIGQCDLGGIIRKKEQDKEGKSESKRMRKDEEKSQVRRGVKQM
jgi:hypothetical protein